MNERQDERFLAQVRRTLDAEARHLDGALASRLEHIRTEVVGSHAARTRRRERLQAGPLRAYRLPAAVGLACLVLLGLWWMHGPQSSRESPQTAVLEDFEVLAAEEDAALLENVDFYAWLAEQDDDPA